MNVKDSNKVKDSQKDLTNFTKKFLGEDGSIKDAAGYHKSLYTAMNPDAIAQHFYEQGKADAVRSSAASAKNIDMDPRQSHSETSVGGVKYKVLRGDDSATFKVRLKNK